VLLISFVFVVFHIARNAGKPLAGDKMPGGLFAQEPGATRS
jgi:hypothetical protein